MSKITIDEVVRSMKPVPKTPKANDTLITEERR